MGFTQVRRREKKQKPRDVTQSTPVAEDLDQMEMEKTIGTDALT
jgi:hypothetical protein